MKKSIGIKSVIVILYIAITIVLCVTFVVLLLNNHFNKQVSYDCLMDKTDLYIDVLNKDVRKVTQELKLMQINDGAIIQEIPSEVTPENTRYYDLWNRLAAYNINRSAVEDYKYTFFEYNYAADLLVYKDEVYFKNSDKTEYVQTLSTELVAKYKRGINGIAWDLFSDGDETYLYSCFNQHGNIVGCVISLEGLTKDFNITNMGYEGFFIFESNNRYYPINESDNQQSIEKLIPQIKTTDSKTNSKYAWRTYKLNFVGSIKVVVMLSSGVLARNMRLQTLSIIAFVLILIVVLCMIWYLYNIILIPMRKFVEQLKNPTEDVLLNENNNRGPVEIMYANSEFKKLYRELQSLRIDLYEKELESKSIMLEYAQEQIKPHFFLNCMSVIQSMAELHHEQDIVNILDVLSDYMKYVLKDTFGMRHISDEIKHLQNYMDIQKLCKPGLFEYEAFLEDDVENYEILPLILQVFAENSVKYGLTTDRCTEINVYITKITIDNEKYLYIVISDTGNGFPQYVLEQIEKNEPVIYNGCEHFGISNTIKRIHMTYGDKSQVKLSNMKENYGAVVEITLPIANDN